MSRTRTLAVFLGTITLLLFATNTVVCTALLVAFDINPPYVWMVESALAFLGASFIAATIIGNFYHNIFVRAYYTLSAIWMGTFFYLFLASLLYGALVATSPSLMFVGPVLFILAIFVSVYAVLHARKIVVTHVPLALPNLPQTWRGRKIVWISDIHLGHIHGKKFMQKIVDIIQPLSPDMVFIGGDLYDGARTPDIPALTAPLSTLRAPLGVYFITGNHEEYGDVAHFLSVVESTGARVLKDELFEVDGLQLIGVDYKNASDAEQFKTILANLKIDPNKPSILLKHEPRDLHIAAAAGVSLQISGHTHKAQLWPLGFLAERIYKGFAYGLHTLDRMQVYTSSGVGTWGPPMRVGTHSEIVVFTFK